MIRTDSVHCVVMLHKQTSIRSFHRMLVCWLLDKLFLKNPPAIGSFFCFCPNQNLPERPPPWLRPEEERKVLLPPPEEEEELCTRRLRVVEYR